MMRDEVDFAGRDNDKPVHCFAVARGAPVFPDAFPPQAFENPRSLQLCVEDGKKPLHVHPARFCG
jgi:hypothetical protein